MSKESQFVYKRKKKKQTEAIGVCKFLNRELYS